ncbi:MAG: hypothetical protein ACRDP9_07030, partial [Kribbellaceae bacterium]
MRNADGTPAEMRLQLLSDYSRDTDAVATCTISKTQCAVLVRMEPADRKPLPTHYPLTFSLVTLDGGTQVAAANVTHRPIAWPALLEDGTSFRIAAAANGSFAIASCLDTTLRVAILPATGSLITQDIALAPAGGRLSGLTGLRLASLRFNGPGLSLALTAEQTLPGVGAVSQGVILRLLPTCQPDPAYGEDGLWISPLRPTHRTFRCAGETTNGIAGHDGNRIVMYGVVPDGGHNPQPADAADGLLGAFGIDGIAETDLGGQIRTTSIASDAGWIYVLAQRLNPPG